MKYLIAKVMHIASSSCLLLFAVLIPTAVIARFALKSPIGWIETICALILVVFTTSTAVVATCEKLHVAVRLIPNSSDSLITAINEKIIQFILTATFSVCSYSSFELAMETSTQVLPEIPQISASFMYWPIFVGFVLMSIVSVEDLFGKKSAIQVSEQHFGKLD